MLNHATLRKLYNFSADEPLAAGDPRYVALDARGARGSWRTQSLARRIELSGRPVCEFIAAPRGAGVTTELFHLGAHLEQQAELLVVHIDATRSLDLTNPIDELDVLTLIAVETERTVIDRGGDGSSKFLERVWRFLKSDVVVSPKLDGPLPISLMTEPGFRNSIKERLQTSRSIYFGEVHTTLQALEHNARKLGRSGIVVFLDGLHALRGVSANRSSVLDSAERIFASHSLLRNLPLHVISTLPLELILRPAPPYSTHILPMIALNDEHGGRNDASFAAAEEIISRRISEQDLEVLFGTSQRASAVERIIASSGGSPRTLLRLLRECIVELAEGHDVPQGLAKIIARETSDIFMGVFTRDSLPWLARVHLTKKLSTGTGTVSDREIAERSLADSLVYPFSTTGETWFDLNPAILRDRALLAAIDNARLNG